MFDQVSVCVCSLISSYPFQTVEQIARIDLQEAIDADVPHISLIAVQFILNVAVLFYLLAARTSIKFFGYLNADQMPFPPGLLKIARD